ncbi:conserved Plasmodium protein, unknown function [Plasmodium ovale]|uniref:Apicoplast integral membrane protein n=1 Tax=Plasmodium ovale TaxID=36330 RepID=A0A1C3KPV2_PLAOA|nr:conserved Plasmodium protein, unknown function [Plasmodium ovale]
MKRTIVTVVQILLLLAGGVLGLDVNRRGREISRDRWKNYGKVPHKRRLIYGSINFHNIENNLNNDVLRKRYFYENDGKNDDFSRVRKIKNIIYKYHLKLNKYSLGGYKNDINMFRNKTKDIILHRYHFAKKYYILIVNRLKDDMNVYYDKVKNAYTSLYIYLKRKYVGSFLYEYIRGIPLFNKSSYLSKIVNYNSVNLLFLLFTLLYFKSNYMYTFFKKKYAFIGEFKNMQTEKLVKIHTLSTLLFFFYKFFILRLLFILNSHNFFSKKLYIVNNLVHVLFFSYISVFPYFLVKANWGSFHLLGSRRSKILGTLVLLQLFLIYLRLIFQNNLSFLRKWTDEQFFNKEEILKNMKEDRKMDFYVNLLNHYSFLKRLYLGNNKIYEVALHLHRYKYILDIISPINSLFYIYIAHSIYFYLNNLSFAGIYVSSFSLGLLFLKLLSNKIDMYFLTKE